MIKTLILFMQFAICSSAISMGYPYMSDNVMSLSISSFAPTRISFVDDKIIDVLYYPDKAITLNIHAFGFAYIMPSDVDNASIGRSVYITIVSKSGLVQDLKLNLKHKEPEPIRIIFDKK